jgi:hypothetical protein
LTRAALCQFAAVQTPDPALVVLLLDLPRADRCDTAAWRLVIGAVADARPGAWPGGYRGAPAADMKALVSAILAVQDRVVAHAATLLGLALNPLVAPPGRAVALDAPVIL